MGNLNIWPISTLKSFVTEHPEGIKVSTITCEREKMNKYLEEEECTCEFTDWSLLKHRGGSGIFIIKP